MTKQRKCTSNAKSKKTWKTRWLVPREQDPINPVVWKFPKEHLSGLIIHRNKLGGEPQGPAWEKARTYSFIQHRYREVAAGEAAAILDEIKALGPVAIPGNHPIKSRIEEIRLTLENYPEKPEIDNIIMQEVVGLEAAFDKAADKSDIEELLEMAARIGALYERVKWRQVQHQSAVGVGRIQSAKRASESTIKLSDDNKTVDEVKALLDDYRRKNPEHTKERAVEHVATKKLCSESAVCKFMKKHKIK